MAKAGYDPNAIATILTKFDAVETATTGRDTGFEYLNTPG